MSDIIVDAIWSVENLEDFFGPVDALVDECILTIDDRGLSVRTVEPANVATVETTLETWAAESYHAEESVHIGLDVNRFLDVLGLADSDELVRLRYGDRRLDVTIGGLEANLSLIDIDSMRERPTVPEHEDTNVEVVLPNDQIDRAVSAADLVGDHIEWSFDVEAGDLQAVGAGDRDDIGVTWGREDLVDGYADEDAQARFSLDYMKDMVGAIPDVDVTIKLVDDFPITLEYAHIDGACRTKFSLCPRVTAQ